MVHCKVCLRNDVSTGFLKQVKGTGASCSFKIRNEPKPEKKIIKKAVSNKFARKYVGKKITT